MKTLKKILCLSLVFHTVVFVATCFISCNNSIDEGITLTEYNIENYVNLSCTANGLSSTYKNGKYSYIVGRVTCTGIAGYEYKNVTIYVKIIFDDGTNYADPEITINLNYGGNGSSSKNYAICNKKTETLAYVSSSTIHSCSSYKIEMVSGKVKKM